MDILINALEKDEVSNIIQNIKRKNYFEAANNISASIEFLHKNIPEKKRISYGIVHTIKVLSEYLFNVFMENNINMLRASEKIFEISDNFKSKIVALGILSFYGLENFSPVVIFFERSADSSEWQEREISCILFRKLIKRYPGEMKKYLMRLVTSESPYIRRFVAETLRPVQENKWFFNDIDYPLEIVSCLFDESSPYPRTSVGNNLSDISKKLPETVFSIVERLVEMNNKDSYWIAYRACRNLVKKYPQKVKKLLRIKEYIYKKNVYKL